ncbi:Y_Y_Y domain-containing protein [Maribacter sedimenticola]|uniref:Y_Y_Y domain-containing protein n=1 Tax=Maribacter sedimenticola TaxID=228956 RepID=A0ABY1SDY7_9FLAO|nr:triple tyrosine motif-containing protein [Maribacter sedimenticola]SNR28270.1 Y_Y_Y domain-containing protein [Maribacter sedimenticola]
MVLKPKFWFLLYMAIWGVKSQDLPPIQNYAPLTYAAGNQNWGVSQGQDKSIYIANNSGLLMYNGTKWVLYPSPNGTPLKSVRVIGDRIYTGCYMEFGYWTRDALGQLEYVSISSKLTQPIEEDEHFWTITQFNDWVLFRSLDRIYSYHIKNGTIDIINAKTTRATLFEVDRRIYFQSIGKGLFTVENGRSVLVSDDDILKNDIVVGAFSFQQAILLITEQHGCYLLRGNKLEKWATANDPLLSNIKVYSTLKLHDGSIVMGTISKGLFIIDERGIVTAHIDQEQGIHNNTVLSMYQDMDKNLWLGLDNGLSVINLETPFKEYVDHVGELGVVYTAILYKDVLYLGTNQGLFYRSNTNTDKFKRIEGTQGQVWLLKNIDGTLFCGHHTGTFVVRENTVEKISDYPGTWDIHPMPGTENLLLQGNYEGLSVLKKVGNDWTFENVIDGFESSSRFFEFVNDHQVLVNHDYKGIFDIRLNSDYTKVLSVKQKDSKGTGSSLVAYHDDLIYTTVNGVFKYDKNGNEFLGDTVLNSKFFENDDAIIGVLKPTDNNERLWGFSNNNIINVSPGIMNGSPEQVKIPIPKFFRNGMGVVGFESIVGLGDQTYLIGTSNGYVTLNLDKVLPKSYSVSITSISKEFYDAPSIHIPIKDNTLFDYTENNLKFQYNVPEYDKFTEVYYQYKLNGLYTDWSSWSTVPEVSFKNLPFGNYTLQIRAKVGNALVDNVAMYNFKIERPWYLSIYVIIIYVLLGLLLLIVVHKLYKSFYKKQQEQILKANRKRLKRKKLKAQKKIIQIKNEQLQDLIESKNRELAISTMSIIKKNEFLNAIKDKLKDGPVNAQIKSVIKTIDRNINNEDDWKFFENAFNNADKDFLKKIKSLHPELSSNDLRLCAYLRLNLSSKEIAPLLNISLRSVEVKRYRLRKKMNLLHEEGLTDYIMSL